MEAASFGAEWAKAQSGSAWLTTAVCGVIKRKANADGTLLAVLFDGDSATTNARTQDLRPGVPKPAAATMSQDDEQDVEYELEVETEVESDDDYDVVEPWRARPGPTASGGPPFPSSAASCSGARTTVIRYSRQRRRTGGRRAPRRSAGTPRWCRRTGSPPSSSRTSVTPSAPCLIPSLRLILTELTTTCAPAPQMLERFSWRRLRERARRSMTGALQRHPATPTSCEPCSPHPTSRPPRGLLAASSRPPCCTIGGPSATCSSGASCAHPFHQCVGPRTCVARLASRPRSFSMPARNGLRENLRENLREG